MPEIIPSNHNPPLILVADDDKITRIGLRQAMEQEGYQVVEANDGEACLAIYARMRPDIVLLDAIMPGKDGFTCCVQIQRMNGGGRTPVLMITGLEDQESVDQAFAAGAVDYITKPIHWAVLRQRVRRLIQQVRLYQQLEQANHELQRLASFDGLTQVANRRRFDEYLQQEWKRMLRDQTPLSLIMCDIDCFKRFNDTYGHQAGDNCLRQVANVIQNAAKRSLDLPARYGGEEFAVILPSTDQEGAIQVAQTIQIGVRELAIAHSSSTANKIVTVSLGIATTIPSRITSPGLLITAADKALYQAKHEGRDRYSACVS
ncbi:MAG: PleD family two-component system response regulator [Myxacorys chilensis ATA2-1-KO14]|jgi:diguanylate cyclase (GGDEF)-like protein|nr:PleD family two-component system response regulator [Myxacorys chilensis ATA2-1-KO14]